MGLFLILFGWVGGLAASSGWPRFGRNGVRHAMKSKTKLQRVDYTFRRDQVLSAEIGEFQRIYDPTRLSPFHLRCLFGRLRLAIEDVMKCEDAVTIPEARKLILTLHAAWPWAGFFLNLDRSFGSSTTLGALPILAYAMCLMDMRLSQAYVDWKPSEVALLKSLSDVGVSNKTGRPVTAVRQKRRKLMAWVKSNPNRGINRW
jgi:hypothetical protein